MRLHIDGEPARLFFRYKKTFMTGGKLPRVRADIRDRTAELTKAPVGTISYTEIEQGVVEELPPNITEAWIVKGWDRVAEEEAPKIAFGRSWRHPKDPHNKHLARTKALAHAVVHWPREARRILWIFLHQRGQRMQEVDGAVVLDKDDKPIWIPWDDLNIVTDHAAYPPPKSPNKGATLKERALHKATPGLDPD